jgi:uncharacterized protein YciI
MWYVISAEDTPNSLDKRIAFRPAHIKRLQDLQAQGRLFVAGAHPAIDSIDPGPAGFTGSIMIVEFNSLEEAQTWAQADPFVSAGVYGKVTVKPFRKAVI